MKILVLAEGDAETRDSWSGTSLSVVQHLRGLGHSVQTANVDLGGLWRVWTVLQQYSLNRKRWWVKYHLGATPFRRRSAEAAKRLRMSQSVDVILQFGGTFAPKDRGNVPYVLYCDGNIELSWYGRSTGNNDASVLSRTEADAIRARELLVYRNADAILTISERLRESFIQDFGIPADRVLTVYAGPNFDTAAGPPPASSKNPDPTILFMGRQFHRKGGDLLLAAFRLVKEEIPDARLVIAGPTDLAVEQPGVEVLGFIAKDTPSGEQELRRQYSEAHVFCMPSRFEGFAISFLEAMWFGLPCVSTHPPWSPPEMIVDGETGFTVAPEDTSALAARLVLLLRDGRLASDMGERGRRRVLELFTWPAVALRIEAALIAAAKEARPKRKANELLT
jgi:alpha-maltose-1-phosphate synthase